MRSQVQPSKREWIFLIAGIAIGLGVVGFITGGHFYSVVHTKGATLYSWPGPSDAKESLLDRGGDGMSEGWMMAMSPHGPLELETKLVDSNHDGKYDTCTAEIRPGGQESDGYLLVLIDTDHNGIYDGMQVSNTGTEGNRYVDYSDWNLDGFLDIYVDKTRRVSWIATGTEWLRVLKPIGSDERRYLVERDGEEREIVFRDDVWVDVTPIK